METELNDLRALLDDVKQRLVIADTERKTLKIENALLQRKADDNLEKATRMETILSQVSAGLVAGLKEMREERDIARALRIGRQEEQLGVGGADSATFLARGTNRTRSGGYEVGQSAEAEGGDEHDQDDTPRRDEVDAQREANTDRDRGDQVGVRTEPPRHQEIRDVMSDDMRKLLDQQRKDKLAGAVEQVAVAPTSLRQGRVDPRIADRDDRMPRNEFGGGITKARDLDEENLRRISNNMTK
jgi:hypothetical protein